MSVDDIEKAKPKENKQAKIATRDIMKINDIDGTSAKQHNYVRERSPNFDNYDYRDVTAQMRASNRCTNPLDPTYKWSGVDKGVEFTEIGEVEGSKPMKLPDAPKNNDMLRSLRTKDIMGATSNSKGLGPFETRPRRCPPGEAEYRNTNLNIKDISGTTASSLLRGIKTNRKHSPLRHDDYQYLGWKTEAKEASTTQSFIKAGEQALGIKDPLANGIKLHSVSQKSDQ